MHTNMYHIVTNFIYVHHHMGYATKLESNFPIDFIIDM